MLYHYAEYGKMVIHHGGATGMVDFVEVSKMVVSTSHQKPFRFMRS